MRRFLCIFALLAVVLSSSGCCCCLNFDVAEPTSTEAFLETEPDNPTQQRVDEQEATVESVPTAEQNDTEPQDTKPENVQTEEIAYLKLDRYLIDEASFEGFTWPLFCEGSMLPTEIAWSSDDSRVATVDIFGNVCVVGEGRTIIRAVYKGIELATCTIICDFEEEYDDPQENEESGTTGSYVLYCQYGALPYDEFKNAYSAALSYESGEWIGLYLEDPENSDRTVEPAWTIVEGECRLDPDCAGVTATSAGTCKLKAEYNGQLYYLIIYCW